MPPGSVESVSVWDGILAELRVLDRSPAAR